MKKLIRKERIFGIIKQILYLIAIQQKNNKLYEDEKFQIGINI
jgi:hypothetical protein